KAPVHSYGFRVYEFSSPVPLTKERVVRAILDRLIEDRQLSNEAAECAFRAVMKRETQGSTGIGRGIALPHSKHPGIDRVIGAIAKVPSGVDFASRDGEPVHLVCLLLTPTDRPGESLRALEAVCRGLREDF